VDSLEVLKEMPDKSINLVLTDPTYFLPAKHYQTRTNFRRNFSDPGFEVIT
jgi:DNA modification methylase